MRAPYKNANGMLIHFSNLVVVDCTTPDQQQQREDGSLSSSPVFPAVARFAVGGPQNNVWRMFSPIEKEKVQKTRRNTTIKLFWAVQLMAESLITTNDESSSSVVGRSFFFFLFSSSSFLLSNGKVLHTRKGP